MGTIRAVRIPAPRCSFDCVNNEEVVEHNTRAKGKLRLCLA